MSSSISWEMNGRKEKGVDNQESWNAAEMNEIVNSIYFEIHMSITHGDGFYTFSRYI